MKKTINILLYVLLALSIESCEKDDICIESTTPKLIIRFYDDANPTILKKVNLLTVWSGSNAKIYDKVSIDSIAMPIDINQNFTNYSFLSGTTENELQFSYDRSSIFVSRSCGFKMNFTNLQSTPINATWIKNVTINTTTIENETAAHINIYH
ncbi:DUF6452 family protein [Lutibacter sp.]|uniref:DUF6452 family protein n=1 Tax=Lutibacter sp. TaxID=1925666 RepID=UPI002736052C|nr:DUF6452 family protein [Lutibacter sp.]MDP3313764.1 DUF6452 family protein [Lutibacter sp.]